MEKQGKDSFDPKMFLAKVGAGKAILKFHKNQNVFAQGDVADAVFYIQNGKVKVASTVLRMARQDRFIAGVATE